MSIQFDVRLSDHPVPAAERAALMESPGFGKVFTDHMATIRWNAEQGWYDARIEPYGPFTFDPASQVFHYGQEIFEGLKAYRRADGTIAVFRPYANAERMNSSAERMAMPALPVDTFVEAIERLVETDREWVPTQQDHSLYLRPFMIAAGVGLGINSPSSEYLFAIIASPAASYFSSGPKPVSVWLSTDYTRAAPGGTGFAKCGGNYAASFVAQAQAVEKDCDQVVWLDALEHRWVEEMGGMNMFFVYGSHLVTPPLTGTLLPGVTRDSILALAGDLGLTAEEGRVNIEDWRADAAAGRLTEVFACGTAAVVTPVGHVKGAEVSWSIGGGKTGDVTLRIRDELTGIQFGGRPDPHGWVHKIG
jgi:branched-chain amino acid aminotransferase